MFPPAATRETWVRGHCPPLRTSDEFTVILVMMEPTSGCQLGPTWAMLPMRIMSDDFVRLPTLLGVQLVSHIAIAQKGKTWFARAHVVQAIAETKTAMIMTSGRKPRTLADLNNNPGLIDT